LYGIRTRFPLQEKILLERSLVLLGIASIVAVAAITVFEVISGHDGTLAVGAFTSINTIVNLTMIRALTHGRFRKRRR
jgi:hypothetical protein